MTVGREAEPFEQTTRPADYLPRPESEQALDRLQTWARSGGTASIRFVGGAGMGKSLLLRVLAERIAGQTATVHVPYSNLMPDDLASWVLETIGERREHDPQAQMVEVAKQRAESGGLLLLIDDAERLPTETLDALELWFQRSEDNLRSVRAVEEDSATSDDTNRDERDSEEPTLTRALDVEQSTALLTAAMDRAGLDGPLRARFNQAVMLQLRDRARGVPARLLTEAARLYQESCAGTADPTPTLSADEPPRAPTQRALAQLELALAAKSTPTTKPPTTPPPISRHGAEQSPLGLGESLSSRSERAVPRQGAEQSPLGPAESPSSRSEPAEPRGSHAPARLLDLPAEPPRAATAARSRVALRWVAAVGGAALLLAFASTLLPTTPGGDVTVIDSASSEPPPVAAGPVPPPVAPSVVPPVVPPTPVADAGVGSIEFRNTIPVAPDPVPEVLAAPVRNLARTPAPMPAEIETPAEADNVVVEGVIESGEWLAASFRRLEVPSTLATVVAREVGDAYDFRLSQQGDRYRITRTRAGELVAFVYEAAGNDRLELSLVDGGYRLERSPPR